MFYRAARASCLARNDEEMPCDCGWGALWCVAVAQDGVSLVDSLPLPLVNRHDVRVLCSDTACYSGPAARAVRL